MTSLSDTLTVGLVLVLLFGSIALYLYTRIQQAEQKISLLEGILLDLKMSTDIKSYTELPAHDVSGTASNVTASTGSTVTASTVTAVTASTGLGADHTEPYIPYGDEEDEEIQINNTTAPSPSPVESALVDDSEVDQYKSVIADAINVEEALPTTSKVAINYESATLKELQNLAKSRGITGAGSMKKGPIIEALKTSDRSTVEPGSFGSSGSTFLETSGTFLEQESK